MKWTSLRSLVSGIWYWVLGIWYWVLGTGYLVLGTGKFHSVTLLVHFFYLILVLFL